MQFPVHGERSKQSLPRIPATRYVRNHSFPCKEAYPCPSYERYCKVVMVAMRSTQVFREMANKLGNHLRSETLRCCPQNPAEPFVARVSVDARMPYHQNVETLQLRWCTNNAQMRIALHD